MSARREEAVSAFDAAKRLNISLAQVKLLVREGRLRVTAISEGRYGKEYWVALQDVQLLTPRMAEIKKSWRAGAPATRGQGGSAAEVARSVRVRKIRSQEEDFLDSLALMPEARARLLRAAFYLFHLNHYAKAGHPHHYQLKSQVLRVMSLSFTPSDGLELSFVDGGSRVLLCDGCRREAQSLGLNYKTYVATAGKCKRCKEDHHYYSLYEFLVTGGNHRFTFHSPYPVASKWLRSHEGLPSRPREPVEREDGFSFGRPITAAEATAIPLYRVVAELQTFVASSAAPQS